MKTLLKLKEANEKIKVLSASVAAGKKNLMTEIENIQNSGLTPDHIKKAIDIARKKAIESASKDLASIRELQSQIMNYEKFWSDKYSVMSRIPVTARGADGLTAENIFQESMTRQSILSEARLQTNEQLKRSVEHALDRGNIAEAYLLSLEGNHREIPAGINLSGIEIREQQTALELVNDGKRAAGIAMLEHRELSGANPGSLSIDKLTLAHSINLQEGK